MLWSGGAAVLAQMPGFPAQPATARTGQYTTVPLGSGASPLRNSSSGQSLALPIPPANDQISPSALPSGVFAAEPGSTVFYWPSSAGLGKALAATVASTPRKPVANIEMSVFATTEALSTEGVERTFTAQDVESSVGTFGDLPRFIQTLAGVVSDSDQRNDYIVRGGSPEENLFVIDNIEVPSINQLALSDTTGGLVSMLDNNAIQHFDFHDDAYGSHYEQRLSSIVDISTRTYGPVEAHHEVQAGIAGVGGSMSHSLGANGSYFLSAREGILQYISSDIGMNGTPHYRNAFARAENTISSHDSFWGMSLFGIDSISINPDPNDPDETNPYNIQYNGWRSATGVNWQHIFSPHAFAVASVAHTEQAQNIAETDQILSSALIYSEHSRDGASTLKYDVTLTPRPSLLFQFGTRGSVDQLAYDVGQPIGLQNPYSTNPAPLDGGSFDVHRPVLSSAVYGDATWTLPHGIRLSGGERYMQWTLPQSPGGQSAAAARASLSGNVFGHLAYVSYAEHAQLPPELFMLAFNNLQTLKPIRSRQVSVGVAAINRTRLHLTLDAYNKQYSDYPVASSFPQLSLANIADTFGQAFLMFPMTSQGAGTGRGVEATLNAEITHRLTLTTTSSYSRIWFSGQDGIFRRGNYDIPAMGNFMARWRLDKGFVLSGRFNITSGRPYTPDNLPLSLAQNRDVYDLTRINAVRASSYQRLDFKLEQARKMRNGVLTWHVGLENMLNRANFYAEMWEPRILTSNEGGPPPSYAVPESVQHQIPRFPDAGIQFTY